ncbi:8-amino-7-oxononanoate synthase [Chitinibacter bivalviorum]|uniref:8-amino-7-oxononanoate synthase n=1 Tax=Chitinibacter bivalviorum TaxID=2739434 RepID=A0A7H9BEU6_9NEIS|nr:8-amino-7-oxononanoate synthase [Chitinibacter bivalviorum]QLG87149.1 8-amino-7-oxononanoate synthase [Chitinibacter bivalviorum]
MSESPFLNQLATELSERESKSLYRRRRVLDSPQGARVMCNGCEVLNFCSNDYLGLANHPSVVAAAQQGAAEWGVGSGAAHLVAGHFTPQHTLEERFAAFSGKPAAILLSTGFMANLAVIPALLGRGDAVFADKLNHASLNDACQLARADFKRFAHNDVAQLERLLAQSDAKRKLIAVDAVFSMDGDIAPLAQYLALAEQYDALLYIDDAHGFGVLGEGRGTLAELGLDSPRIIYMATLGKAAGVAGAYIAAEQVVIDYLINTARSYIYTTAAPPLLACALHASLDVIEHDKARRERLLSHIRYFKQFFATELVDAPCELLPSDTAIQPLIVKDNATAVALSQALLDAGLLVAAIRPPTVATPRLRVTLSAAHSDDDVKLLCREIKRVLMAAEQG